MRTPAQAPSSDPTLAAPHDLARAGGRWRAALALTPLALALLAAFPNSGLAQTAIVRPPAPAPATVPRPLPGWRVSGTGAAAPVNRGNAAGGIDQTVTQTSQRGIYNWQSFDIGSASSVTFAFPTADSSALNRVLGTAAPSQIFGTLRSVYANPDPTKAPLTGGSLYLINANGILFGRTAQVNVGSLIASTLNLSDTDFNSGLTRAIAGTDPAFSYQGPPELFTDERNFVAVDPGATITTASGGRVFLFARNVQNGGTIRTPDGQTVLAAGSSVYLNDPTAERLYASEVNPQFPALRGLLVEVGGTSGTASNLASGLIDTPRGNTTLVGMAVNQNGRISATTSVNANGSVLLLARGAAVATSEDGLVTKHATQGGTLTLGAGSSIEIAPDSTPGADGKLLTSDDNTIFTASRVALSGRTIELQPNASIVAHGGIVDARAEAVPYYPANSAAASPYGLAAVDPNSDARIVVGQGARIDVSGTTGATVSAGRNFVTSELIGRGDLRDAPLQQDGPLYRSRVTFDVREGVPILGDTSSYAAGIQRTAEERLSTGGTVSLFSTGSVFTHADSMLGIAGGAVNYTEATVRPTRLIAADGTRYELDRAPADLVYVGIENASTPSIDRWGVVPQWRPAQASLGRIEPGYVDGRAGGTLTVVAPHAMLDGHIAAGTVAGVRQTSGADAMPVAGAIAIGLATNAPVPQGGFGEAGFITAGIRDIDIARNVAATDAAFWSDPLAGAAPDRGRIAASTLNESGAGRITITADGGIAQAQGADLNLADRSTLSLAAAGSDGISIGGSFHAAGGGFTARTVDLGAGALAGPTRSGSIVLQPGQTIDVSGEWVNRALDGPNAAAATAGGSVSLSAAHGLILHDATRIDVSGGATVSAAGAVTSTAAGSIALESNLAAAGGAPSATHLGSVLVGESLAGGGTLRVRADRIDIGGRPLPGGIADGASAGSLLLSDAFFEQGAFTTYDIGAVSSLSVQPGATIAPRAVNWIAGADARTVASGSDMASFLTRGTLPDAQRAPVNLRLAAVTPVGTPAGSLLIGAGATIEVDPRGRVDLVAARNLVVDGTVIAPGGTIAVALSGGSGTGIAGTLRIGEGAGLDASGTTVLQLPDGGPARGTVLAGGTVSLGVSAPTALTQIEVMPGAVIAADGASATLGVTTTSALGATVVREQTVSSDGGAIRISAIDGGASIAGDLHARAGGARAAGGSFSLALGSTFIPNDPTTGDVPEHSIVVQQAAVTVPQASPNSVLLSARSLSENFADVSLQSADRIRFSGDVNLAASRDLVLDAPVISASPNSRAVQLSGGSTVRIGSVPLLDLTRPYAPVAGTAALDVRGGLVELTGQTTLQGLATVGLHADSEIRLNGARNGDTQIGRLSLQADLLLDAPQVAPTTASQFTIDATGQRVTITGGDTTSAVPLSAGGSVAIQAREILVGDSNGVGVVRAPLGSLTLDASERIAVGSGSLLSVSGAGLLVPYGSTVGGETWTYGGTTVSAPPVKSIDLIAPGHAVQVNAGATLDLSGGGDLVAYEFVPGPGGSRDVFAGAAGGAFAVVPTVRGYAPQDAEILSTADASGARASAQLGRQVTFGAGGPLPAGTYTVLPARYALLPGAFLVRPVSSSAPLELGAHIARPDGSVLVGGQLGTAGTNNVSSLPQTFRVVTSTQAQRSSEIRQTRANDTFIARALAAGTDVPRLPMDAGRLDIAADQLVLQGRTLFALPTDARARGGELDISADRIRVSATPSGQAGVLDVSPADLNATGASLLVLGGVRDGSELNVAARSVELSNAGAPLQLGDVVLAAREQVNLGAGASIVATGTGTGEALHVTGDGALLRVSGDATVRTERSGAGRAAGDLSLGEGVSLRGGSIVAEATRSNTLADSIAFDARSITIGGSRIAVGLADAGSAEPGTTVLTPALAASLGGADALTLRGFDGIDFYGSTRLGGSGLADLTLDAGTLRLRDAGSNVRVEAGQIALVNTSGGASDATAGTSTLTLAAAGAGGATGGSGQVTIGPGSIGVAGSTSLRIDANREAVVSGETSLATGGDLTIAARSLQGVRGAEARISAGGAFTLTGGSGSASTGGLGAHLEIDAARIEQGGRIDLASGELVLNASGGGAEAIHFATGSTTNVAGRATSFDGVTVATGGGTIKATASTGGIDVDAGATLDASAPSTGGARAGTLSLAAPNGAVLLDGTLRATASRAAGGGSLSVDSAAPLDLAALASRLAAGSDANTGNFVESLSLRNRSGDQTLAAGTTLSAREIGITSDSGRLTVAGSLVAQGRDARIDLAAGGDLTVQAGASLAAHDAATSATMSGSTSGAEVSLASSTGRLQLDAGSRIDTTAGTGGQDGSLLLRASVTGSGSGSGVAIAPIASTLTGVNAVEVEAVRVYDSAVVDSALIARVRADNAAFAGSGGAQAQAIRTGLANGEASLLDRLELRTGAEVRSSGDLRVTGDVAAGGWNLASFDASGRPVAQGTGAPMNVTLRAAGDLLVQGSISDGFLPSGTVPTTTAAASRIAPAAGAIGEGGRIRLVGGADLSSADVLATHASADSGDVRIGAASGASVLLRSTTGSIDIAAGRDVVFLNRGAAVYTTGLPLGLDSLDGYVGNRLSANAYLASGTTRQNPFLSGGGSIGIDAGRDLVGASDSAPQYGSDWLWRNRDLTTTTGQAVWFGRYDRFRQGVATFGGGSVQASAGRDAVDVELSAASSGYVGRAADGSAAAAHVFGGGDTTLEAGRDVIGGFMLSGRGEASVRAGRDIASPADRPALQVLYGDTQVAASARNDLDLGAVAGFGLVPSTRQFLAAPTEQALVGVSPNASLVVESEAGSLVYRATPTTASGTALAEPHAGSGSSTVQDRIVPDSTRFVAFSGDATIGRLVQAPAGSSSLQLLAQGNVDADVITVTGTRTQMQSPQILSGSLAVNDLTTAFAPGLAPIDMGVRTPVRIVAADGDATLAGVAVVRAIRVIAGRDILLGLATTPSVELQHQADNELSLLQAGRDIVLPDSQLHSLQDIKVHGGGDLVAIAGRDVRLQSSGGLGSLGNRENASLPAGGARITVLAGVSIGQGDYAQAAAWYVPLLGGTGIAGHASDLYAQLVALAAGQALPALGSSAAQAFAAAPVATQIQQARALLGDAAFNAALVAFEQRREGNAGLTLAAAQAAFDKLDAHDQASVVARALATAWVASVDAARQRDQALAMATAQGADHAYTAKLAAFVQAQTGRTGLSADEVLQAFAALAPERQLVFTNQVLFDTIRSAGREASQLGGDARDAAYARAYDAIDVVFPAVGSKGDIDMGSSQVRSLQGADIAMLAPRGGINVGALATGPNPKPSSELGVVTAAGGGISMLVQDDVEVNQSRVFTVGRGDLLMWSSEGNLDAGRGAKTVTGAPPPVFRFDAQGNFVIDTSGSFTGSGIAVLDRDSTLDLYAPKGEINAGDAGIKSLGNAFFGAVRFVGGDNLSVGGVAVGAPPPPSTGGATASVANAGQAANQAANRINPDDSEDEKERKRRRRLNLVLEFLGFGDGASSRP